MTSDTGPFDWWNLWKNTNSTELHKNWTTDWVPDQIGYSLAILTMTTPKISAFIEK